MQALFIGGCDRSGTTLLAKSLEKLNAYYTTPESLFKTYDVDINDERLILTNTTVSTWLNSFRYRLWQADGPKAEYVDAKSYESAILSLNANYYNVSVSDIKDLIWVDHSPNNLNFYSLLRNSFSKALFIHIVRDGRAVYSSVKKLDWGPSTATYGARWWLERLSSGLSAELSGNGDVMRVYYEDLVKNPDDTIALINEWVIEKLNLREMVFDNLDGALKFRMPSYTKSQHSLLLGKESKVIDRTHAWKSTLSPREIRNFEAIAGGVLRNLGYKIEDFKLNSITRFRLIEHVQELIRRTVVQRVKNKIRSRKI